MKLYITPGSPYARIARVVILEKELDHRIEIVTAQTRTAASPYYRTNPSGRVPYLTCDGGLGLEESALICDYLDRLDGTPRFALPAGTAAWEPRRLEARARSMLDGLAVWSRELGRPQGERSPTILLHEAARAARMAQFWEREIDHPWMTSEALNMAQITLACTLSYGSRNPQFAWRPECPRLAAWHDRFAKRPAMRATEPPARR